MTNGYTLSIVGSNYVISVDAMGESADDALENALYTLINSEPKIDLFGQDLRYQAELIEENVLEDA